MSACIVRHMESASAENILTKPVGFRVYVPDRRQIAWLGSRLPTGDPARLWRHYWTADILCS